MARFVGLGLGLGVSGVGLYQGYKILLYEKKYRELEKFIGTFHPRDFTSEPDSITKFFCKQFLGIQYTKFNFRNYELNYLYMKDFIKTLDIDELNFVYDLLSFIHQSDKYLHSLNPFDNLMNMSYFQEFSNYNEYYNDNFNKINKLIQKLDLHYGTYSMFSDKQPFCQRSCSGNKNFFGSELIRGRFGFNYYYLNDKNQEKYRYSAYKFPDDNTTEYKPPEFLYSDEKKTSENLAYIKNIISNKMKSSDFHSSNSQIKIFENKLEEMIKKEFEKEFEKKFEEMIKKEFEKEFNKKFNDNTEKTEKGINDDNADIHGRIEKRFREFTLDSER